MQSYEFTGFGDAAGLKRRERAVPDLKSNQILVRVRATSVNYRDVMVLNGTYPVPARVGLVPISDGAGEVCAIGQEVVRFAVGDRVAGTYFNRWRDGRLTRELAGHQLGARHDGMLTEYRALDEEEAVAVPSHLSFEEAATLPCAALTGWSGVNGYRPVVPGDTVLVVGGGAVALFAVQFAKIFGARVIAVTSKSDKATLLRSLGADEVVVSSEVTEWDKLVLEMTGGRGVEHVVEAVGPATLARSIRSCAFDAEIALIGIFMGEAGFDGSAFAGRLVTVRRVAVGSRAAFEAMNRAIGLHRLRPVIDRVFPFADAQDAYRHFVANERTGKVVIAGAA
jgi:NADPH:quinone reductase-like Zn-dependent oxidoreductase